MKKQARNQKSDAELLPQEKTSNNGGSPNRQERVPPPTVADVKERIAADRKRGPERPLRSLAGAEEALKLHSSAMTKISDTKKKRPDPNLVVHQLTRALDTSGASMTIAPKLREETVALYRALETDDPISSVLGRVFVVTNNSVLSAYERANYGANSHAREVNLKHAERGAKLLIALAEALTNRGGSKNIMVGTVTVEAGGQAFVGTVETKKHSGEED